MTDTVTITTSEYKRLLANSAFREEFPNAKPWYTVSSPSGTWLVFADAEAVDRIEQQYNEIKQLREELNLLKNPPQFWERLASAIKAYKLPNRTLND
jgi:hypothetical protein